MIFRSIFHFIKKISISRNLCNIIKLCNHNVYITFTILLVIVMMKLFNHKHCSDSSSSSSSSCSCESQPCTCSCSSSSSSSSSYSSDSSCSSDSSSSSCGCGGETKCETDCCPPYSTDCKTTTCREYQCNQYCYLDIILKSEQLCIPQFMLRYISGYTDFFFTFKVCGLSNSSIHSLILLKDILQWTSEGVTISEEILPNGIYPILFVTKNCKGDIEVSEYLKLFVSTDDLGVRTAFISKGSDYLCIYNKIYTLLTGINECPIVTDLLNGSDFYSYHISDSSPLTTLQFLIAFLSLYVNPDCLVGNPIRYDLKYCTDTKKQLEYFFEYYDCNCEPSTLV